MAGEIPEFIECLTRDHRVLILGGLAVIAHGRDRHTKDADIWLEPMESSSVWASVVARTCGRFNSATIHRLPGWSEISGEEIAQAVDDTGVIRILGLGQPLDIFRRPNEFDELAFDDVIGRAQKSEDGTYLPDPLDLLQSKLDTTRDKDQQDIFHLEHVTRRRYFDRLPTATLAEATEMLDRFADWQVLRVALGNPDPAVQALARRHLEEFAEAGDPFSQAILAGRPIPGE
ncbi:hypothetical protein [Haloferula sp. A504]|uniref:hypothetical protein n=1 Tax=Haloferula sp. A504 TaxID=3373601 RepID=UPI0031CA61C0|nr:hypothetical protein [Verrucomicrobiaceae bacterium E54]